MIYLYRITNLINNKIYVGIHKTDNINDGYMGSGRRIVSAIEKYGLENFKKEILEYFDTYENALLKEKEIVTEEFIKRPDVYNLCVGGYGGGLQYIRLQPGYKEWQMAGAIAGGKAYSEKVKSLGGAELVKYKERMSAQSALGVEKHRKMYEENGGIWWEHGFKGKTHSEETLDKMRGPRLQSSGINNSQFNTCWLTKDKVNKKVKKNETIAFVNNGWQLGRYIPKKF